MAIPLYEFANPALGTLRKAIPIRLACLMAGWTPALMAGIISGLQDGIPPLLDVYEFDPNSQRIGEVRADAYDKYRRPGESYAKTIAAFPTNHFVWSDDLVLAYSDYIDEVVGRESAAGEGYGIRWNPELGDSVAAVTEAVDLAALNAPADNRVIAGHEAWTFAFDGIQVPIRDSGGLRYVIHLLLHPGKPISAGDLILRVNPSVPAADDAEQIAADLQRQQESDVPADSSDSSTGSGTARRREHLYTPDKVFDKTGMDTTMKHLAEIGESLDDAKERGNEEKVKQLTIKRDRLLKIFRAGRNKTGRSRVLGSEDEKIRKSVGNAITRAIDRLEKVHPRLAEHLLAYVSTGSNCEYRPPDGVRWSN